MLHAALVKASNKPLQNLERAINNIHLSKRSRCACTRKTCVLRARRTQCKYHASPRSRHARKTA
eukprot:4781782-Alexandrium_andersonii.AAC.1